MQGCQGVPGSASLEGCEEAAPLSDLEVCEEAASLADMERKGFGERTKDATLT